MRSGGYALLLERNECMAAGALYADACWLFFWPVSEKVKVNISIRIANFLTECRHLRRL